MSDKENSWNKGNILTARWNPMSIIIIGCASSIYLANTDKILTCRTKGYDVAGKIVTCQTNWFGYKWNCDAANEVMTWQSEWCCTIRNPDAGDVLNNFANASKMRGKTTENIHTTGRTQRQYFEMSSLSILILKATSGNVNTCTISHQSFMEASCRNWAIYCSDFCRKKLLEQSKS